MAIRPMIKTAPIQAFSKGEFSARQDQLVIEEPLEIQLAYPHKSRLKQKTIAVTMRTPGKDAALAAGFLFTESILVKKSDIAVIHQAGDNRIRVELTTDISDKIAKLNRHFYTSSSCGICGKTAIDLVKQKKTKQENLRFQLSQKLVRTLPGKLRKNQAIFQDTGGIHAAGLFNLSGEILYCAEDVGRHNALDKLIGHFFLQAEKVMPFSILVLSGRTSFELIQKAMIAKIPVVVAVGAPSSLAVEMASDQGMTLLGFTGAERFNIYCGAERISR